MTAKHNLATHLNHLHNFIKDLKKYQKMVTRKTFLDDKMMQKVIERTLQQTLEVVITIGEMVISEFGFKKPDKNRDIFKVLAQEKIYSQKLAEDLAEFAEFRNILVHDYVKLDLNKVYDNLIKGIPIFKQYIRYIAKYLK
ncbi:DUF86 domain-containing protein [Patescibacteria group bacterium]|nr:DUF86 domain-containing protein [Patescibacteria group bacterium]